jgi:hypothetical protein
VVIAPIGNHTVWPPAGPAGLATHRRDGLQQRDELGHVVAVAAGQRDRERDAVAVGEQADFVAGHGSLRVADLKVERKVVTTCSAGRT